MSFKQYFYNCVETFQFAGTYTWTKPADLDPEKPILVHVWGAGGGGRDTGSTGADAGATTFGPNGGGGGGLAVKYVTFASLGATETITIGAGSGDATAKGGTSSFGAHCSATGGNGGADATENESYPNTTAWSAAANYVVGDLVSESGVLYRCISPSANHLPPNTTYWKPLYGIGGMGVGGDANRRGGQGGYGYWASNTNAGGGGGGSAPAPYGVSDGFSGGRGHTYSGGGGGGIGGYGHGTVGGVEYWNNGVGSTGTRYFDEAYGDGNGYSGGAGGGSMFMGAVPGSRSTYTHTECGGNGLITAGGTEGGSNRAAYVSQGGWIPNKKPQPNEVKCLFIRPNEILIGGGGGTGGHAQLQAARPIKNANHGQPGGGGGGGGGNTTTAAERGNPGNGGFLGGGGGAPNSTAGQSGNGGNAGGGGGSGYRSNSRYSTVAQGLPSTVTGMRKGVEDPTISHQGSMGGDGVVIIQYSRLFV